MANQPQSLNVNVSINLICRLIALVILGLVCLGVSIPFGGFVLGLFFWVLSSFF